MSHSVSFGVRAAKLSPKLTPKYQLLCHLLQARTDFELRSSKSLVDLAKGILKWTLAMGTGLPSVALSVRPVLLSLSVEKNQL